MFCEKCGAKNPDGSQFCSSCGNKLAASGKSSGTAPVKAAGAKKLNSKVVIGILAAAAVIVLVAVLAGRGGGSGLRKDDISGKWYEVTGVVPFEGEELRRVYEFRKNGNLYTRTEGGGYIDGGLDDDPIGTWEIVNGDSVQFTYNSMRMFYNVLEESGPVKVAISEDGLEITFFTDYGNITLLKYPEF